VRHRGARLLSRSARATLALGARLGRALEPGDVVALVGELGSGKTQFVRGACRGAGVPEAQVSSPSFAIVATYRGRIPVHHADLYRIASADELHATGFGELVGGAGALLVEWADRVPSALPVERLEIRLGHHPRQANTRRIELVGTGERYRGLAAAVVRSRSRRRSASPPSPAISGTGSGSTTGSSRPEAGVTAPRGRARAAARGRGARGRGP
jgi:tRNA threonylcarbamoyladenosine biosynthesis protein TsaE